MSNNIVMVNIPNNGGTGLATSATGGSTVTQVNNVISMSGGCCTINSGAKVMISAAPLLGVSDKIGTVPTIIVDMVTSQNVASSGKIPEIILPNTVTASSDAFGFYELASMANAEAGTVNFQLTGVGGAVTLSHQGGSTSLRAYRSGNRWFDDFASAEYAYDTPEVYWAYGSTTLDAGFAWGVGENQFGPSGNAASNALAGGYIGFQQATSMPTFVGSHRFAAIGIGAAALTQDQISRIRASLYALADLKPQANQYNLVVISDSLAQVSSDGLNNWPHVLSRLLAPFGVRVTNGGWISRPNASYISNWGKHVDQFWSSAARKNILIWWPSANDPIDSDCISYFNDTLTSMAQFANGGSSHKAWDYQILLTNPNGNKGATATALAACNALVVAKGGALAPNVRVYDLAGREPLFNNTTSWNTSLYGVGPHFTSYLHQAVARDVAGAILPLLLN